MISANDARAIAQDILTGLTFINNLITYKYLLTHILKMLLEINNLIEGTITKRPSKVIKSPYVADVIPLNQSSEILAHSASLGCCGLADAGATILMTTMPIPKNKNTKQKCQYRIYISVFTEKNKEIIVGIHPKLAENLTENALKLNYLSFH